MIGSEEELFLGYGWTWNPKGIKLFSLCNDVFTAFDLGRMTKAMSLHWPFF